MTEYEGDVGVESVDVLCDELTVDVHMALEFWASGGGMVLVAEGGAATRELISGGYDPCGRWENRDMSLELAGTTTEFGSELSCQDFSPGTWTVTIGAWVNDDPSGVIGDCVAWGPAAMSMLAGDYDYMAGPTGPPGGLQACRLIDVDYDGP